MPMPLRAMFPNAIPWRERDMHNATAHALIAHGATDAEAADFFAMEVAELRARLVRLSELTVTPMRERAVAAIRALPIPPPAPETTGPDGDALVHVRNGCLVHVSEGCATPLPRAESMRLAGEVMGHGAPEPADYDAAFLAWARNDAENDARRAEALADAEIRRLRSEVSRLTAELEQLRAVNVQHVGTVADLMRQRNAALQAGDDARAEAWKWRADLAASERSADRLRHGQDIESDHVCPGEIEADRMRTKMGEAREALQRPARGDVAQHIRDALSALS